MLNHPLRLVLRPLQYGIDLIDLDKHVFALRKELIDLYYYPYHRKIQKSIRELDLQLCLDCHSMASINYLIVLTHVLHMNQRFSLLYI